jgi:SAM-dependent methyltransferase
MPMYKYVGNTILTRMQNMVVGEHLSEWHSGYRAYSVQTLTEIPFEQCSDDYNFDTQIILQLHEAKRRIIELPIPTFYGDEISYVNGMKYARQCAIDVARYRAQRMGLGTGEWAFASVDDEIESDDSERIHERVVRWFEGRPPARVLDLGCGSGVLGERLRALSHHVTGVDRVKHDGVGARLDQFVEADLELGLGPEVGAGFDVVIAADVIGHVRNPEHLLVEAAAKLRDGGALLVSVPNFAHWYPRGRVLFGRFDYDRRGILDAEHLRFFTRRSAERCFTDAGLELRDAQAVGLPLELLARRSSGKEHTPGVRALRRLDRFGVEIDPSLFAYQFLFELAPVPDRLDQGRPVKAPG